MSLNQVLLIGACGNLGTLVLKHLLSSPFAFRVTVLTRASSVNSHVFPPSVRVITVSDDYPVDEVREAFQDIDVVIAAVSMTAMHHQYKLIDAAVAAGVKRYFPTEFGLDSIPDWLLELRPMFRTKHDVRDYLITKEKVGLSWTSIVCNVFFEMGIKSGFFGFLWDEKKAVLIDGGGSEWPATTLETVAIAMVRAIEKSEDTKNKVLLIQDFPCSQKEILQAIRNITGDRWTVENRVYEEWLDEAKNEVRSGDNKALTKLTFASVLETASDWESRPEYANRMLALPTKSFEVAIAEALKK
ncbi:hypothetical protein PV10_07754 [Exophiala mesophila]|uniref:NmrA-like domain-containing protein n=1 Tax=Exophiala mesophila TaxID=212818 RepID=A0A0D1Z6H7_EXOME|nr:uncharacterized protein PV10_07754 [Exophiala mesophila]KIV90447.1 hypothetical protein PV10_07754 [Exophiala mesophila]